MPSTDSPLPPASPWRWRALAVLLIVGSAALHLAYLAYQCPLDLAPDEAHYWDWSRHLDWSYYSKGPLVAYLIRGGCLVAGEWSQQFLCNEMFAVRLPAVGCGTLLLVSLYVLTRRIYDERLAVAVVAGALTLPLIAAGSSLMTIDAPYACCWGWALVLGHQAIFRRSAWAWPAAGLVVGLGILAKYTMIVWVPSLALFLLTSPEQRRLLLRPGFWVMGGVAALCCLPILVWNVQHDWVSLRHVEHLARVESDPTEGPAICWLGPLNYLAVQCAVLLVFWFFAWLAAMIAHRPWVEPVAAVRYLWWLSAPMFVLFLLFSFKTGGGEPNWPVMAYISGLVLTVARLREQLQLRDFRFRRLTISLLSATCAIGIGLTILAHHSEWVMPEVVHVLTPLTRTGQLQLRRIDPSCRLRGWRATLAAEVDRLRAEIRARQGVEPVLAGTTWTLPGELAFYCDGHPTVYSLGLQMGDRHSQYDYWRPNPVDDLPEFAGRTFIVVGCYTSCLADAFEEIEPLRQVPHYEKDQLVSCWTVMVGHRFRGFPAQAVNAGH